MKDIRPVRGKYYINSLISEGEHEHQDFKFAISDAAKIARSISAFANNDGGRLLVGVKDNGNIAGVRNEEDIYVIEQAALMYCRPPQQVSVTAFRVEGGAVVLRADIAKAQRRPVCSREPDGSWRAYYRVKDENIVAHPVMVKGWRHAANDSRALLFSINENEASFMEHLGDDSMVSVEDYMRALHLSRASAESALAKLYAAGVVDFVYSGTSWLINRFPEDSPGD